ncbi:MAG TPA: NFACT RNA binding domain-containing protein [Thermaerobacter sp.]
MDGLLIAAVLAELRSLLPARVERIYQPDPHTVILHLYAGAAQVLLISADPRHPRIHLTRRPPANPAVPPAFCMLLRKHLESARLVEARQGEAYDRWVELVFRGGGREPGAGGERRLVAELIDRRANILLLDEAGHILDAIRRVPAERAGTHAVLPGLPYEPPPAPRKVEATPDAATLAAHLAAAFRDAPPERPAWRVLLGAVPGTGRELVREALRRAGLDPEAAAGAADPLHDPAAAPLQALAGTLAGWLARAARGEFEPALAWDADGTPVSVTAFAVTPPPGGGVTRAPFPSELCDRFYGERLQREAAAELRRRLEQAVREAIERVTRRRDAQRQDLERAERAEPYRLYGELLTAFAHQVPRGARQVQLPNYYDPEGRPVTVPLDPALGPQENAQRYFRLYQKARRGREQVEARLRATEEELAYLRSVEHALAEAEDAGDLETIAAELAEQGYLNARDGKAGSPGAAASGAARTRAAGKDREGGQRPREGQFLRYMAPGGRPILVGKNNRQNDWLVTRVANDWDIWLHAKDVPGSHVLLRRDRHQGEPDEEALLAAARVAAYHSRARWSSQVPVDYTEARYVRKPRGARPGFVLYDHARTVFVTPDPETLPPRWPGDRKEQGGASGPDGR